MNLYLKICSDGGWFHINKKIKQDVFFPAVYFENIQSIEKLPKLGARDQEYYWMNYEDIGTVTET